MRGLSRVNRSLDRMVVAYDNAMLESMRSDRECEVGMAKVQMVTVTPEEAGQKLLQFLQRRVEKDVPKSAIMRWIRTGQVRVNKGRVKPFVRVEENDIVRIPPYTTESTVPEKSGTSDDTAQSLKEQLAGILPVVAEDEGLLVIHKPVGLPVQPGTGHTDAVTTRLKAACTNATFSPTPAHRLDKNTSGLLLVATSYARLQELHGLFRNEHAIGKHYLAWVEGCWESPAPIELHDVLEKESDTDGKERVHSRQTGKEARCTVHPLVLLPEKSLLHIELQTGRTHQIRVQLATRKHPIIGDTKYGATPNPQGMLLHAWRIVLPKETFIRLPDWKKPFIVSKLALDAL